MATIGTKIFGSLDFIPEKITSEEMAAIDLNSEFLGVPRSVLMENAGAAVARHVMGYKPLSKVCVFAGPGNNGGDAFVAARILAQSGVEVFLALAADPSQIRTAEARENWRKVVEIKSGITIEIVRDNSRIAALTSICGDCNLIIDGILGTGLKGELREPYLSLVRLANISGRPIISIDAPTGLDPTTGKVMGVAVLASVTITFHKMKVGLLDRPDYCGKVIVEDIGVHPDAEVYAGPGDLMMAGILRDSPEFAVKKGKLLIITNGEGEEGANSILSFTALKMNLEKIAVITPQDAGKVLRSRAVQVDVHTMEDRKFKPGDTQMIIRQASSNDAVVVAEDIGRQQDVAAASIALTGQFHIPFIFVGDCAVLMAKKALLSVSRKKCVLLLMEAEFASLMMESSYPDPMECARAAVAAARKMGVTLVIRGSSDVITDGMTVKINRYGTGNSGDSCSEVLAGIAGAVAARGSAGYRAGVAASFLTGMAMRAAGRKGLTKPYPIDIVNSVTDAQSV